MEINNSAVYLGINARKGKFSKWAKTGETAQELAKREKQIKKHYGETYKMLKSREVPEDNKACRLLFEAVIRYRLSKVMKHHGNDWFKGNLTEAELIKAFDEAYDDAMVVYRLLNK